MIIDIIRRRGGGGRGRGRGSRCCRHGSICRTKWCQGWHTTTCRTIIVDKFSVVVAAATVLVVTLLAIGGFIIDADSVTTTAT